jgi:hypothetical protein
MRWLWLCCSLLALVACDASTTIGSDFGVTLPGCYLPTACWTVNCNCNFATLSLPIDQAGCMVCDPATQPGGVCDCGSFGDAGIMAQCQEQAEVCVGRAATTCNGSCVHKGVACGDESAVPPDEVASVVGADGGPATEKRCAYADDVCCN